MVNRKRKSEQIAGFFGIMVLVFLVALFIVFLEMIPDVLTFIQTTLGVDEFFSKVVLFIGLLVGIFGFSWIGYQYMPRKRK